MKKASLILAVLLLLPALAACSAPAPAPTASPTPAPTAEPTPEPEIPVPALDRDNHWLEYSDGTTEDVAAHTLSDGRCTGCGAEISVPEEGVTWVQLRNAQGDCILWRVYDAEGALTRDTRSEFTYDAEGNKATETVYEAGRLTAETEYAVEVLEDGTEIYPARVTRHMEDGTRLVEEHTYGQEDYTETLYDAEGTAVHTHTITHEYDNKGRLTVLCRSEGSKVIEEVRYAYDRKGNILLVSTYRNNALVAEDFYTTEGDVTYLSQRTEHRGDGSSTVTLYDAGGNVIN